MYGMSRDRLFLSKASVVNHRGTPSMALIISTVTEVLLVASSTFEKLLAMTSFFWVVMYGSGFASLIALRGASLLWRVHSKHGATHGQP